MGLNVNIIDDLPSLAAAGAEAHVARLQAELDTAFSATWRGRLALKVSRWYAWLATH